MEANSDFRREKPTTNPRRHGATSRRFYCLRRLSRREDTGSNFLRVRCRDNHIHVYTVSHGRQFPHFKNLGARKRSVFGFMFQGLIPRTTVFDTHLIGGRRTPEAVWVWWQKNALQLPEIKSKKTIPAMFT
jgi:hypothetical protein